MNRDLVDLMVPQHEIAIEAATAVAKMEIRSMAARARAELEERFARLRAFHNRSIAQRRRFRRIRSLLQEKEKA